MRNATLLAIAAVLALAVPASAQCTGTEGIDFQRVTIGDINDIPQANIDQLNAAGENLTTDQIEALVASPLTGERVEFTAVILTNPLLSGLASANEGIPGRIHVFLRDTAFDTEGAAGQGTQIVDNRGDGSIQSLFVGDEVTVCGLVTYFGSTLQIALTENTPNPRPFSVNVTGPARESTDPILDPVVISTDDIHDNYVIGGENRSQIDWNVYGDFVNQYVRLEAVELLQGVNGTNGRPNLLLSTTGDDTTLRSYDTSVCFRNDRDASYFPANQEPACNMTDFVAPPSGIVNVQGFLTIAGTFDAFGTTAVPAGGAFSISPFEASDFEVAVAPPSITIDESSVPTASAGVAVSAEVTPGTDGNTVASVVANYTTSGGASGQIALSNTSGDTYSGTITGINANEFITYTVVATDNQNAASTKSRTVLVLDGPVSSISDVQRTQSGGAGASSLITTAPIAFDLDAVVQTAVVANGRFQATIQDDPNLGPFTGVLLDFGSTDPGLSVGDQINISQAQVSEFRDVTQLTNVTYTTTGSGDAYAPKTVSTVLFAGNAGTESGEQFESMLLRFEGGSITNVNPDAPSNFGEFAFSTDGTAGNQLRVDDASADVPVDFNSTLTVGQSVVSIEGYLSFSFGDLKLIPVAADAIVLGGTAVGTNPGDSAVGITGSYPNPTTGTTRVRFELARAGDVSLTVFDAMGRQVATVTEGAYSAASHDVSVDLGGLATGVYVLRLQAGGEVATSRLAVIR